MDAGDPLQTTVIDWCFDASLLRAKRRLGSKSERDTIDLLNARLRGWANGIAPASKAVAPFLYFNRHLWIRSLQDAEFSQMNRQGLLIDHLLARYRTPVWLSEAVARLDAKALRMADEPKFLLDLYLHVASGRNLRTYTELRISLTRAMAHAICNVNRSCRVEDAFLIGIVSASGGSEDLARLLLKNHFATHWPLHSMHLSFIEWCVRHEVCSAELQPITMYVQHLIDEVTQDRLDPVDFTSKPLSVIRRAAEEYQKRLKTPHGIGSRSSYGTQRSGIRGYMCANPRIRIIELQRIDAIIDEGVLMHHCVGTYTQLVSQGECAIFSIRALSQEQPLATIEVRVQDRTITQIRGPYNRRVDDQVMEFVRCWCVQENLRIAGV